MFEKIAATILKSEKILIVTHINPDGDALGSSAGLKLALEKTGKKATVLLEKEVPGMFEVFGENFSNEAGLEEYDLVISLDCGDKKRLGECEKYVDKYYTINIDHHISNTLFGDENYVDSDASATGEIVYELICFLNIPLDEKIAGVLYGAILTDTGGFMFSNTTVRTHHIAAELIKSGADFYTFNKKLMIEKEYQRQKITAECINRMDFFEDGKICVVMFPNEFCTEISMQDEDLNGIASVPRTVSGVEVGVLISEINKGTVKVSLRSDRIVDVSFVAEKFGGGGHKRASGIRFFYKDINEVKQIIVNELTKQLEVL